MVVLSGDRPNSVNVRFRVILYSLSSVGCQISFSGFLLLSVVYFNKLSTVSSWNGYLRFGGCMSPLMFSKVKSYRIYTFEKSIAKRANTMNLKQTLYLQQNYKLKDRITCTGVAIELGEHKYEVAKVTQGS
ncbi:hypothetical protein C2G38_2138232 [Gigaspora rosea]|uniref:Uncharacterized protein n=1 Tax=Gigaspora rosea TaxID=44941 RepID=A0A397VXN4_9GLOM|nr:hypothetical protein C2G38_2138232 [Gigaspora rosea]